MRAAATTATTDRRQGDAASGTGRGKCARSSLYLVLIVFFVCDFKPDEYVVAMQAVKAE